ncbi:MAG TPA: DNA transposition protein [Sulfurimonas sp. UBA12504]|nr:MAG TPA: DNA transposition protein [Sulfurimonas sp. UBA12504]
MKEEFITTVNYSTIYEAVQSLKSLPRTAPKMGLGFGHFGLGKTFSLEKIAALENAILLRAAQTWTKSSVLTDLCEELGVDTNGHGPIKYKRVIESLVSEPRIIIVDEIDALLRSSKFEVLEMFRDFHDETGVVIFFVGMEESNRKLKKHKHFYSRIVEFVEFQAIFKNDIEKFCSLSDVLIKPDLIEYFYKKFPNLRQVKVLLIRLEKYCALNDIEEVDFKTFKMSGAEYGDKK